MRRWCWALQASVRASSSRRRASVNFPRPSANSTKRMSVSTTSVLLSTSRAMASALSNPVARPVLLALEPGHPSENRADPTLQGHVAGRLGPALAFVQQLTGLVVSAAVPREIAKAQQRRRAGPRVYSVTRAREQALEAAPSLAQVVMHPPERPDRSSQAQGPVTPVLGEPVQGRADVLMLLLQAARGGDLLGAVALGGGGPGAPAPPSARPPPNPPPLPPPPPPPPPAPPPPPPHPH